MPVVWSGRSMARAGKCPGARWACQTRDGIRIAAVPIIGASTVATRGSAVASCSSRYHRRDDRPRAPDRRRRSRVPLRRVRGRSRRARAGAGPPPSLLRGASPRASRVGAPGGVLPLVRVPGLPDVPGLGPTRGRDGSRRGAGRGRARSGAVRGARGRPADAADRASAEARARHRHARPARAAPQPAPRLGGAPAVDRRRRRGRVGRAAAVPRARGTRHARRAGRPGRRRRRWRRRGRRLRSRPWSRIRNRLPRARGQRRRPARRLVRLDLDRR